MKLRIKEFTSKRRVVVELTDDQRTWNCLLTEVGRVLNIPSCDVRLSLNHGETILEAHELSPLNELGIVSGDLITCMSPAEPVSIHRDEPPATRPRIDKSTEQSVGTMSIMVSHGSAGTETHTTDSNCVVEQSPYPQQNVKVSPMEASSSAVDEHSTINQYLRTPALLRDCSSSDDLPVLFSKLLEDNQPGSRPELLMLACHQLLLESGFVLSDSDNEASLLKAGCSSALMSKPVYRHVMDSDPNSSCRCTIPFVPLSNNLIVHGIVPGVKSNVCLTLRVDRYTTKGEEKLVKLPQLSSEFKDSFVIPLILNLKEVLGMDSLPPILDLPYEVILMILKTLGAKDKGYISLIRLGRTCRMMSNMCFDNNLWKSVYMRRYSAADADYTLARASEGASWYSLFKMTTIEVLRCKRSIRGQMFDIERILDRQPRSLTNDEYKRAWLRYFFGAKLTIWYCTVCHLEKSVRNGSFFSEFPKISLIKLLHFIYEWSEAPLSLSDIHRYGICRSTKTPVALRKAMVQLCNRVMERVPAPRMGGVGQVVEVDESVFRRRKYHRGRLVVTRWVFGMVSLQHNRPRARFFVVGDRRAVTLSRVIQANVLPGTTIRSDEWRGYNGLNGLGYQHQTVNHSRHFVNPVTGAHTNNIENCWRWAKAYVKAYGRATSDAMLHYHLTAYMWRKNRGEAHPVSVFAQLVEDIALVYPI